MSVPSTRRHGRIARLAALASAILHLALAVSATHDIEVHRLEAAARLPQAFHHHEFSLAERAPDVRPSIVGECLACHLSRLVPRLLVPVVVPGASSETLAGFSDVSSVAANRIVPSPRVTRGPPLLSV
ncbi:MAG: hypothetical protein ACREMK_07055 [Gemmatimonadota bacterium]